MFGQGRMPVHSDRLVAASTTLIAAHLLINQSHKRKHAAPVVHVYVFPLCFHHLAFTD